MPARPVVTTRRSALAAAVGVTGLAVAGCTSDSPDDPTDPVSTSAPPVDADQSLVDGLVVTLASLQVSVDALSAEFPALRRDLAAVRRMHGAHLAALGGFDDSIPSPAPHPAGRQAALEELVLSEQRLQRRLATAAVTAESGTLAKLLATMSAAVAQHVAVLG